MDSFFISGDGGYRYLPTRGRLKEGQPMNAFGHLAVRSAGRRFRTVSGTLIFIFTTYAAGVAIAGMIPEALIQDFSPLAGVVVKADEREAIIDAGRQKGVKPGDVFTVTTPGEVLTHPVSGEAIGRLDRITGVLWVRKTKPRFSHAMIVSASKRISRGDKVLRAEGMPAVFNGDGAAGGALYRRLQTALPHITFSRAKPGEILKETSHLVFSAGRDEISVRLSTPGAPPLPVRTYASQRAKNYIPASPPPPEESPAAAKPIPAPPPMSTGGGGVSGLRTVDLPKTVIAADFLSRGEKLLLAAAGGSTVTIYNVSETVRSLTTWRHPANAEVLSVQWWMPPAAEHPRLALTAWQDNDMVSAIIEYNAEASRPILVESFIYRMLGSCDRTGDGIPETLLGQRFHRRSVFSRAIDAFRETETGVEIVPPPFPLPEDFILPGSLIAPVPTRKTPLFAYRKNGNLIVHSGASGPFFAPNTGGSLASVTYDVDPDSPNPRIQTAVFETAPVLSPEVRKNPPTFLVSASETGIMGSVLHTPDVRRARVMDAAVGPGGLSMRPTGPDFSNFVQGLGTHRGHIYVITTKPEGIGSPGESRLTIFPVYPLGSKKP